RVLIDADAARLRWKVAGPDNGDAHAGWQPQLAVTDRETSRGVVQRGKSLLVGLELWAASVFDLERVGQREAVSPQDLLLGNLRPFAQPNQPALAPVSSLHSPAKFGRCPVFCMWTASFQRNRHRFHSASSATSACA